MVILPVNTPCEQEAARATVARMATDLDDEWLMLESLGLTA